ncbi:S8 family serine peptidase [Parabacteroides sp. OttesenSCG-928-G07]|nr:S8 family serine peptidase [Parabacteroides sp. OttesenSCG-928-G21]MDL2278496.1 S8 family serine peptidase [Parabacteroides sp. OttesenSCG-928-G07]
MIKQNRVLFILVVYLLVFQQIRAEETFAFRLYLKDKDHSAYSLEKPEEFLSEWTIQKREKNNIPIIKEDLPVSQNYLDQIISLGLQPIVSSKWMNTVVVESSDSMLIREIEKLDIIDSVKWVWRGSNLQLSNQNRRSDTALVSSDIILNNYYGYAEKQTVLLQGEKLHEAGYKGEGMRIAMIDAGFQNVDRINAFDSLELIGTENIVFPGESVYLHDQHGTKVLSCIAANIPGVMVGTAPKASYLLIKSEDGRTEYPIEEDYWVAAIEYADSVGVDIISSSLGYYYYDAQELSYEQSQLDGQSVFISRAAGKVSKKGILLCSSAGNEGNGTWVNVTVPADSRDMLTIGSIGADGKRSSFSSYGKTVDGRIKPDVVAIGGPAHLIDTDGQITYGNGTSFAAPMVAGLAACLWQALPELSNMELLELIRRSSDRYTNPDPEVGYGIPDMYKAYIEGQAYVKSKD